LIHGIKPIEFSFEDFIIGGKPYVISGSYLPEIPAHGFDKGEQAELSISYVAPSEYSEPMTDGELDMFVEINYDTLLAEAERIIMGPIYQNWNETEENHYSRYDEVDSRY